MICCVGEPLMNDYAAAVFYAVAVRPCCRCIYTLYVYAAAVSIRCTSMLPLYLYAVCSCCCNCVPVSLLPIHSAIRAVTVTILLSILLPTRAKASISVSTCNQLYCSLSNIYHHKITVRQFIYFIISSQLESSSAAVTIY